MHCSWFSGRTPNSFNFRSDWLGVRHWCLSSYNCEKQETDFIYILFKKQKRCGKTWRGPNAWCICWTMHCCACTIQRTCNNCSNIADARAHNLKLDSIKWMNWMELDRIWIRFNQDLTTFDLVKQSSNRFGESLNRAKHLPDNGFCHAIIAKHYWEELSLGSDWSKVLVTAPWARQTDKHRALPGWSNIFSLLRVRGFRASVPCCRQHALKLGFVKVM